MGGMDSGPARPGLRRRLVRLGRELFYVWGTMVGFSAPEPVREDAWDQPAPDPAREKRFTHEMLAHLATAHAVELETRRTPSVPAYRVTILPVVDNEGGVYARCAEGQAGQWYRRIRINPGAVVHTQGGTTVPVRVARTEDPETVARVSGLYRRKYGTEHPDTRRMLDPDAEAATVRFYPF